MYGSAIHVTHIVDSQGLSEVCRNVEGSKGV